LDKLSKDALSRQDQATLLAAVDWGVCLLDDLTNEMNELHVALVLDVLNLKLMQLINEDLEQFLMTALFLREVNG